MRKVLFATVATMSFAVSAEAADVTVRCPVNEHMTIIYDFARGTGHKPLLSLDPVVVGAFCTAGQEAYQLSGFPGYFKSPEDVKAAIAFMDVFVANPIPSTDSPKR
jgi:hypothetical protein